MNIFLIHTSPYSFYLSLSSQHHYFPRLVMSLFVTDPVSYLFSHPSFSVCFASIHIFHLYSFLFSFSFPYSCICLSIAKCHVLCKLAITREPPNTCPGVIGSPSHLPYHTILTYLLLHFILPSHSSSIFRRPSFLYSIHFVRLETGRSVP